MITVKYILLTSCLFFYSNISAHGFEANTYVKMDRYREPIKQLAERAVNRTNYVVSYIVETGVRSLQRVSSAGVSQSNCYFRISFDTHFENNIRCTPTQEFFLPLVQKWIPAYQLQPGDELLSEQGRLHTINHLRFVKRPLEVYALAIENTHTFCVGTYDLVTHNMALPILVTAGFSVPFGAGAVAGGTTGAFFGPITFVGGCIIGGVVGLAVHAICSKQEPIHYQLTFNTHDIESYRNDAQAPGKPTEKDGYYPPKNWDGKKVRHPKNGRIGWPDKNDVIWVPTGPNGHGGPHWDRQYPNGDYDNIYPGGLIRPGTKK